MSGLPEMKYTDSIKKTTQVKSKGYDHNLGAGDGTLWDMENITGDKYPLLAARNPRYLLRRLEEPWALYSHNGLYWVAGDGFFKNGERKGTVLPGEKTFVSIGAYVLIFPDKAYYRTDTEEFGKLEAEWTGVVTFEDGSYGGEPALANTVRTEEAAFPFRPGEGISITGCGLEENNKTVILREISEDGKEMRFSENAFAGNPWTGSVTIRREVPDMDHLCENENRVWGCKGDTIYASSLGNPFVWNCFDGVATDSFAVRVGSAGDFTAACSFLGYPMFFKENSVYKVYGSKPGNFEVLASARMGVMEGASRSLAIAGERLFYLSRAGVVSYSGGMPENISRAFGEVRYRNGVGGSDGQKYYLSMEDPEGVWSLFTFDTRTGLWYREDSGKILSFAFAEELIFLKDGGLWAMGRPGAFPEAEEEGAFTSFVEFGDFIENSSDEKGLSKIQVRVSLSPGAQLSIKLKFDSEEEWQQLSVLRTEKKRSFVLPVIPQRCDHWRLRLEGEGQWILYSLSREFYGGSDLQ